MFESRHRHQTLAAPRMAPASSGAKRQGDETKWHFGATSALPFIRASSTGMTSLHLLPGEVHVWRISLSEEFFPDPKGLLIAEELNRADKFVFERDRNYFLHARHAMRDLLGRYLGIEAQALPITTNQHGKPLLEIQGSLGFNLSHSGDSAVLAIGTMPEVGIDIEKSPLPDDVRQLAQSVFSKQELRVLADIDDADLWAPFFTCWTRKEAFLKSIGVGLSVDPCSVTVGIEPVFSRIKIAGRSQRQFADIVTLDLNEDQSMISLAAVDGFSRLTMFDYNGSNSARMLS
jgi:4'-phosphopantetheinyl transferase